MKYVLPFHCGSQQRDKELEMKDLAPGKNSSFVNCTTAAQCKYNTYIST